MDEGDILIVKTDMFLGIPKHSKVIIHNRHTTIISSYRINSYILKYGDDYSRVISDSELCNFWTAIEYRKFKIEELL